MRSSKIKNIMKEFSKKLLTKIVLSLTNNLKIKRDQN